MIKLAERALSFWLNEDFLHGWLLSLESEYYERGGLVLSSFPTSASTSLQLQQYFYNFFKVASTQIQEVVVLEHTLPNTRLIRHFTVKLCHNITTEQPKLY